MTNLINTTKNGRLAAFACLVLMLAVAFAPSASAQQYDLRQVVAGTWHFRQGSTVFETVFQPNGHFNEIWQDSATGMHFFREGTWQIQNGILWEHNENWQPRTVKWLPEYDRVTVEVFNYNQVRFSGTYLAYRAS